jgi:hypothetical protein
MQTITVRCTTEHRSPVAARADLVRCPSSILRIKPSAYDKGFLSGSEQQTDGPSSAVEQRLRLSKMGLKSLAGALWISANQAKTPKRGLKPTEEECQKETPSRSKTQEKTFEGKTSQEKTQEKTPKNRHTRRRPSKRSMRTLAGQDPRTTLRTAFPTGLWLPKA